MIGYACKWVSENPDKKQRAFEEQSYNGTATTATWCDRQDPQTWQTKLLWCARMNTEGMLRFVNHAATLPAHARMIRFGSGVLPLYTHERYRDFWLSNEVQSYVAGLLKPVGDRILETGTRVSFHPDHFTVLASENPVIRERSREEIEYHARLVELMGLTSHAIQCKLNVHIGGKLGPVGFLAEYDKLSDLARSNVTVENADIGAWEIESCLSMARVPVVLDLHHHWIQTGEHLTPDSDIWQRVLKTWPDHVKPTIHFSISKEEYLPAADQMPDLSQLLLAGAKKTELRAHSDAYHHPALVEYISQWTEHAHIMLECKRKNLAHRDLLASLNHCKFI